MNSLRASRSWAFPLACVPKGADGIRYIHLAMLALHYAGEVSHVHDSRTYKSLFHEATGSSLWPSHSFANLHATTRGTVESCSIGRRAKPSHLKPPHHSYPLKDPIVVSLPVMRSNTETWRMQIIQCALACRTLTALHSHSLTRLNRFGDLIVVGARNKRNRHNNRGTHG